MPNSPRTLLLVAAHPLNSPRPYRLRKLLKPYHQISVMGISKTPLPPQEGLAIFTYPPYPKRNFLQECKLYTDVWLQNDHALIYTQNRAQIVEVLREHAFDFIFCFDLVLLPIVLAYKKNAKVILDAREYYPAQDSSNIRWRWLFKAFFTRLTNTYMPQCDHILSVSKGVQGLYESGHGISSSVFYSYPFYHKLKPTPTKPDQIHLIYHGGASYNRSFEGLQTMMEYLSDHLGDWRFWLTLMLVAPPARLEELKTKLTHTRIKIIPPVEFKKIINFSNAFDIGLYFSPPVNLNIKHAMPNKFFEYIQSALGVISTPLMEVKALLEAHQMGITSPDFSHASLLETLASLDMDQIRHYKQQASQAAKLLCMQAQLPNLARFLSDL
ncbi:capsular biosynthesis protein [Helicobacter bizzozeronii]|uniref:capsular biosynthesis protein n=1 Tax=Helicobacter bizzozeronii TaxID=56877 RepID=UPI000CF163F8|nr:capsular biosynthesis protein [Helicobacter bizzozeronii]